MLKPKPLPSLSAIKILKMHHNLVLSPDSKSPLVVIEILKLTFFQILKEKNVPYEEHQ